MTKIKIIDTATLFDTGESTPDTMPEPAERFDGQTYDPAHDRQRLTSQLARVKQCQADEQWRTLAEIHAITGDPEASISARLRDLRRSRFGGYQIDRRRRGPACNGLWEYRMRRKSDDGC